MKKWKEVGSVQDQMKGKVGLAKSARTPENREKINVLMASNNKKSEGWPAFAWGLPSFFLRILKTSRASSSWKMELQLTHHNWHSIGWRWRSLRDWFQTSRTSCGPHVLLTWILVIFFFGATWRKKCTDLNQAAMQKWSSWFRNSWLQSMQIYCSVLTVNSCHKLGNSLQPVEEFLNKICMQIIKI